MKRIVAAFAFLLILSQAAWGQIPGGAEIQLNRTPVTGSPAPVVGDCLTIVTGNKVGQAACGAGSVTTFSAGSTGFTPSSATSGAVTLAGILNGANGGTGVNNSGKAITLGGNFTTSGAFASTFTMTNTTAVTFPTSGTLLSTGSTIPLTVAATTITGGTASGILWNNAGVLAGGPATTDGSGNATFGGTVTAPVFRGAASTILTLSTDAQMLFTNSAGSQGFILATNSDGSAAIRTRGGLDSANINTGALRVLGGIAPVNGMGLSAANTVGYYANSTLSASLSTAVLTLIGSVQLNVAAMTQTATAQSGTVCYNSGTGAVTYDATLGCLASSARFKTDIIGIKRSDALALTMALAPVSFRKRREFGGDVDTSYQVGFIAEQVADVDERLVSRNEDGVRGVRYQQMTAILAGAVQELKREIDALKAR